MNITLKSVEDCRIFFEKIQNSQQGKIISHQAERQLFSVPSNEASLSLMFKNNI